MDKLIKNVCTGQNVTSWYFKNDACSHLKGQCNMQTMLMQYQEMITWRSEEGKGQDDSEIIRHNLRFEMRFGCD